MKRKSNVLKNKVDNEENWVMIKPCYKINIIMTDF